MSALDAQTDVFNVIIIDGFCKPEVADAARRHMKKEGMLIVRGPERDDPAIRKSYKAVDA